MKQIFRLTLLATISFLVGCDSDNKSHPLNPPTDIKAIAYTSTDGQIVTPANPNGFGARILSNTYTNSSGTISFGSAVTAIGERAFWQCTTLQSIILPARIRAIDDSAFSGCTSLSEIAIPSSVTTIGNGAFSYCDNLSAFYGNSATLDNRCLVIGSTIKAFAPAGLTTYSVFDGITEIDGSAFEGADNIIGISLPSTITRIDERAFAYCLGLTSITIPSGITEITPSTFEGCSALNSVILPATITEIDTAAFSGCNALQSIYCAATTPPRIALGTFDDIANNATIYVPTSAVATYKSASGWSTYADLITGYDF